MHCPKECSRSAARDAPTLLAPWPTPAAAQATGEGAHFLYPSPGASRHPLPSGEEFLPGLECISEEEQHNSSDQCRNRSRIEELMNRPFLAHVFAERRPNDGPNSTDAETGANSSRSQIRWIERRRQSVDSGLPTHNSNSCDKDHADQEKQR